MSKMMSKSYKIWLVNLDRGELCSEQSLVAPKIGDDAFTRLEPTKSALCLVEMCCDASRSAT
jgi:hypothetical protein